MSKTIVLATGGTGGHIFPAQAIAEQLSKNGYNIRIIADKRYLKYTATQPSCQISIIPSDHLGKSGFSKITASIKIMAGILISFIILFRLKPNLVIGFGGYPSFPVLLAAKFLKIDILLHEQNSVIGKVNKYFTKTAKFIATSFPDVGGLSEQSKSKTILTGNPVRESIKLIRETDYPSLNDNDKLKILIIGGSQGASIFSEIIPEAIAKLPEDKKSRIKISQQCRKEDIKATKEIYDSLDIEVELAPFFTDVPVRLAESHIVICRSGASTLAELATAGRPAIFVPYPHSSSNHQLHNAVTFSQNKAGWVMPQEIFTPALLAEHIISFLDNPKLLIEAADKIKNNYQDASEALLNVIENLINRT